MVKEPGRCIFCGRRGLSKEHVWSKWTHNLVPRLEDGLHERVTISARGAKAAPPSHKQYQGSANTIQLRKACKRHCNSGWMSQLDEAAKPIMTRLILSEPIELDPDAQKIVATWFAMKAMIAEFSHPKDVSTQQHERAFLMKNLEPPKTWRIWIASHCSVVWRMAYQRHASTLGFALSGTTPIPPKRPFAKNTQAITFGLGSLLAQIISTSSGIEFDLPNEIVGQAHQVWPIAKTIRWPPDIILDHGAADGFAKSMERTLREFKQGEDFCFTGSCTE